MTTLITSCNRHDLLRLTIASLILKQQFEPLEIVIHEDSESLPDIVMDEIEIRKTGGAGQHLSIECFLRGFSDSYYLHCEDDWEFRNTYNWIQTSLDIMKSDDKIIKVVARKESPHPCKHNMGLLKAAYQRVQYYGYLKPWTSNDGIEWKGFSWNPGVTRADLLREFMPFPKWEQELAEKIYEKGYRVVELAHSVYTHTGEDRSTH